MIEKLRNLAIDTHCVVDAPHENRQEGLIGSEQFYFLVFNTKVFLFQFRKAVGTTHFDSYFIPPRINWLFPSITLSFLPIQAEQEVCLLPLTITTLRRSVYHLTNNQRRILINSFISRILFMTHTFIDYLSFYLVDWRKSTNVRLCSPNGYDFEIFIL